MATRKTTGRSTTRASSGRATTSRASTRGTSARSTTARAKTTTRRATGTSSRTGTVKARSTASARQVKASTGGMTVQEAGRKGGMIGGRKGGETVLRERGPQFYSEIGKKGGARVRELIERAKMLEAGEMPTTTRRRRSTSR